MTSDDLENHSLLITGPRASFWCITCAGLNMFEFWPQMTQNSPNFGVRWPRMTCKTIFLITGPRASVWYKICLGLKMFGFWPQMTPNTSKWPQPQTWKLKFFYLVLSFNLSYPKLWLVIFVTRYLKNKPKPEVAHLSGSRTNSENLCLYVWLLRSKERFCKVLAKSIREKYTIWEFCRWDRVI